MLRIRISRVRSPAVLQHRAQHHAPASCICVLWRRGNGLGQYITMLLNIWMIVYLTFEPCITMTDEFSIINPINSRTGRWNRLILLHNSDAGYSSGKVSVSFLTNQVAYIWRQWKNSSTKAGNTARKQSQKFMQFLRSYLQKTSSSPIFAIGAFAFSFHRISTSNSLQCTCSCFTCCQVLQNSWKRASIISRYKSSLSIGRRQ